LDNLPELNLEIENLYNSYLSPSNQNKNNENTKPLDKSDNTPQDISKKM
jgi:hypothetical protein